MTMRSNWTRLLCLVLSCVMVFQLLPVTAWAADETSGTCGPNLTWRIEDYTLYIEGEGAMDDYGSVYDDEGEYVETIFAPWEEAVYFHVEMDDSITHIGSFAFWRSPMESIKFPAGLKSIGENAFNYSEELIEVYLPEGLETMGTMAFASCSSLETVTIPSALKVIPDSAFWECKCLENVTIAEGVEEIGASAFADCCDLYGYYISFDEMPGLQRIEIPASVKRLGSGAFAGNAKLTEVVLHEGLEEIGNYAFNMCNYLREVTIPSTVKTVGCYAFTPVLTEMNFQNMPFLNENPIGVMNLYVLSKDLGLYSIDINGESVPWMIDSNWMIEPPIIHAYEDSKIAEEIAAYNAAIADGSVSGMPIQLCLIPNGHTFSDYTSVDKESHTRTCTDDGCTVEDVCPHTMVIDLDDWTMQDDLASYAYRWVCSACDYNENYIAVGDIGGACGAYISWLIMDDTLYINGEGPMNDYGQRDENYEPIPGLYLAPWYGKEYSRVVMDDRITYIGNEAFVGSYFTSIKLPAALKGIGMYAFDGNDYLEEIILPEGFETLGEGSFWASDRLKTIVIPSTMKLIPNSAFEQCKLLETVVIANGVEEIGINAFAHCSDCWNAYNYENFAAIPGLKRIEIPGSVKRIGPAAFHGNVKLTELVLHEGLEEIYDSAFMGCNYLRSVTIPSTVKTIGPWAFCGGAADMYLGENSFMRWDQLGVLNLRVLSKELSLYATPDWETEEGERFFWFDDDTVIEAYPDSLIAREIEAYNAGLSEDEAENRITFYPITDDDHNFSDWVSENGLTHSRTCADCGLKEVRTHSKVIDMYNYTIMTCGVDEQYRWVCTECDFVSEFITDPEWEGPAHDLSIDYNQSEDYHTSFCYNCYQDVSLPHDWSYIPVVDATEPYEVEAICKVCMYQRVITVIPERATIITVKAQDENGDAAELPEGSYTIRWEDGEGTVLAEGERYVHSESWEVSEETPVYAVLSFSDELRYAYSVGAEVRYAVTELGKQTEYLLKPRGPLTVKGKLRLEGHTYLPVDDVTLTLTTTVAGVDTVQTIEVDRSGVFTAQIRRAPTRLDFRCIGYASVTMENIQMMPAVDGEIDLGTITLTDTMAWEYLTTVYTDPEQMELAKQLAESELVLTAVNERTGEEYHGMRVSEVIPSKRPASGYRFCVTFGADMDQYFQVGDSVTIRCSQTDSVLKAGIVKFDAYSFTIAREGEQSELALELYQAPRLDIALNCMANIYLFDSEGRIVFNGYDNVYHRLLERGTYTLVCFRENYTIPTIDAPDVFEKNGVPTDIYVKDTFTITGDLKLEYEVPYFLSGTKVGVSVSYDVNAMENGLIPMQVLFNETFTESYKEGEEIRITFEGNSLSLPVKPIGGKFAFGDQALGLQEESTSISLTVTAHQPRGVFTVYVKPTGEYLNVKAEGSSGSKDYLVFQLPSMTSEVRLAGLAGTRANPNGVFVLYTKLPEEAAPYTAQLYVNSELQSETELKLKGEGKNTIPLKLTAYGDGDSTYHVLVNVVDKNGELVWTSRNQMVTLTNDPLSFNGPKELDIRVNWMGGDYDSQLIRKTIDLKKDPGAFINIPVFPEKLNQDGTLTVDTVFDYALKLDDNSRVKNGVVSMRVFCNEEALEPTIHTVELKYNELTDSFEGTLTLEANGYTVRDLPYGYSFDYATSRSGSAEPERPPFSTEQLVDTLEAQAVQREQWASDMASNVFEFYDPDDVEFTLENTEGLTEEEKEMFRVLLSISNDLYTLREEAEQSYGAVVADRYGEDVLSDSPVQSIQKITDSVSDQIDCEAIPEGSTSADALLEAGYEEINTSYGDFHLNIEESGAATVVDLQNNLATSVSVDYTGQDLETAIATYAPTFFSAVHAMLDASIDATEKVSNYYSNLLIRKLGLEGNIDQLDDMIAKYKTYLGLLEDPITWKSGDYGKDLKTISLEIAEELEEIDLTRQQIEQFKRTLTTLKADLVQTEKSIYLESLARPNLNKNLQQLRFLNSGAGKVVSIVGLDFYGIVVSVIGVVDAIDVARDRENTIENAQKRADRMLAFSNAAAQCTGMTPPDGCEEAYDEYIAEGEDAKDWNTAWFCTKVGQAIGSVGSVGVGLFVKGVPGIIASFAIGIVGGGAELICLEGFNDSLDDMQEIWLELDTNCMKEYELSDEEQECVAENMGHGSEDEDGESGAGSLPGDNDGNNAKEKPEFPIGTRPQIDPAGYVYEAVASNRISGATASIYYMGENGEEIYWSEAGEYGEVNPQITNEEGRFSWMTPIGNWLVKITKEGYEDADSKNDPAAVDGWLPVPPPQVDVNIPLISLAAPRVDSVQAAEDQLRVVFSQYMDIAQFADGALVTVTQDGQIVPVAAEFEDAEVSPTDETVFYGRILKLVRSDGKAFEGDSIVVTVEKSAQNYAGNTLEADFVSEELAAKQIVGSLEHSYPNRFVTDIAQTAQIAVRVLDTRGQPMSGVTVTAKQQIGGTLEMNDTAVSDENGTAVFTVKGISAGYDVVVFSAGTVSKEMNTRISPLTSKAPQKPVANLGDYAVVNKGTELVLTYPGSEEDVVIYYTTNDTCPCTDGHGRMVYDGPITLTEDTFFRIAAWTKTGGYSERLNLHISVEGDRYTIAYDPNGGSGTMTEDRPEEGTVYTLRDCTFTAPVGYRFLAWAIGSADGQRMQPGAQLTVSGDTVLYALWEAEEYALRVTGGYAVVNGNTATGATMGTTVTLIADQQTETQRFVEWVVTGAEVQNTSGSTTTFVMPARDVTAEAVYEQIHVCKYHLTRIEATDPTCTVAGNIEYYACTCGRYYADADAAVEILDRESVILNKVAHSYEASVTAPTCTDKGFTTYTCTVCGDSYTDDLVDALGHTFVVAGDQRSCACGELFEGIFNEYLYLKGKHQKAYQLVAYDGDYYFITDWNKIARNTRLYLGSKHVEGTDLEIGYHSFDAEGKLIRQWKHGVVDGFLYIDNVRQNAYQLVSFQNCYYFVGDYHKVAVNAKVYLSAKILEGTTFDPGYYHFDENGIMQIPELTDGPSENGFFYQNGEKVLNYRLVKFDGSYYFIGDYHKIVTNKRLYLSAAYLDGTGLPTGYYEFDADGKMVIPEWKDGPGDDGYFYLDGQRVLAYRLVRFQDDYYFIGDYHKYAVNKRLYLSAQQLANTGLAAGYYTFGADGKMIIE